MAARTPGDMGILPRRTARPDSKFFILKERITTMPYSPDYGKESLQVLPSTYSAEPLSESAPPTPPATAPEQPATEATEIPIALQVQTAAIPFDKRASRLELFVRILWNFLTGLIGIVYGIVFAIIIIIISFIAGILNCINFLVILITGRRWKTAFNWQAKLIRKTVTYNTRLMNFWMRRAPYFGLMIDQRPTLGIEPDPTTTPGGSPA
jgi:hypothetical protein